MPEIRFKDITKRYGDQTVIKTFSAQVPDKEFLVLLGPSGCGKSTMLRMIAGLTEISSGVIEFDGVGVNALEPKERNVAFVFQSYALYPHLTVRANIAFPLLMSRFKWYHHLPFLNGIMRRHFLRDPDVKARVAQVAEMMELTEHLERRPRTLSGGQRQRVALGRALVREPSVYLLDEPLSNLDAVLRTQMRAEIIALYHRVRKSFIFVTHDQVEAMTMGTRIIVLSEGVVQQYGTPKDIYERPANTFVAKFIGSPPMNLIPCVLEHREVRFSEIDSLQLPPNAPLPAAHTRRVLLGVRAERISVLPLRPVAAGSLTGHVVAVEYLGAEVVVAFRLGMPAAEGGVRPIAEPEILHARMPGEVSLSAGEACTVVINLSDASFFDVDTHERLPVSRVEPEAKNVVPGKKGWAYEAAHGGA